MKPSNHLFILIKSLTKSEKRYFKRFCTIYSIEKQNNYIRLFNAIAGQMEYDEYKIKSKFNNEKFVKQLNVLKIYLYRLIIKSLRQFYSAKDKDMILKDLITHSNILYRKRLYAECYRLTNTAKKAAQRAQNLFVLAELIELEKKLVKELKFKQSEKLLSKIADEEDVVYGNMLLYKKYTKIYNVLSSALSPYILSLLNEAYLEQVEKINHDELMINEPVTNSQEIKQLFYVCRFMLGILQNSKEQVQLNFSKIIYCFNEKRSLINKSGKDNWSCLYYIIIFYLKKGEFKEAINNLKVIQKNLPVKLKKNAESDLFGFEMYSTIYELIINISVVDINKSSILIENINTYYALVPPDSKPDQKQCTAYYFIALYYFIIGKHKLSLDYLIKFTNEYDIDEIVNIESKLKILYVLNKFELGELDHLEYYLLNNLRVIRKNEGSKKENLEFFRTFLKLIRAKTNSESIELLGYLKHCNEPVSNYSKFSISLQHLDIGIWVDSKLFNRKYVDLLQEKSAGHTI